MPNTLGHVGVQGWVTQALFRDVDPKWIYLACVVPDVPWILRRVVLVAWPGIDLYALRAYAIVQSSLLFSLMLCLPLALLARTPSRVFGILGVNVGLHLFVDALQTKWANGVLFLAPFSWDLINWGYFWPESLISYALTALGLIHILMNWRSSLWKRVGTQRLSNGGYAGVVVLIAAYIVLPVFFLQGPIEANNHYMKTLRMTADRLGRPVECDRARYYSDAETGYIRCWNGVPMPIEGIDLSDPARVSIRGTFVGENEIRADAYHVHHSGLRDIASYIGLAMIAGIWIASLFRLKEPMVQR